MKEEKSFEKWDRARRNIEERIRDERTRKWLRLCSLHHLKFISIDRLFLFIAVDLIMRLNFLNDSRN